MGGCRTNEPSKVGYGWVVGGWEKCERFGKERRESLGGGREDEMAYCAVRVRILYQ